MQKSESIADIAKSLSKAQGEIENASKSSVNPHFKSKYADLAEVLNTVRPVFSANGLSFVQMPSFSDGVASVETMMMHESGEWISEKASAPVGKQDAQGVGSVITYLRRYSLAAFAGIAQEDDDANASIKPKAATVEFVTHTHVTELRRLLAITNLDESEWLQPTGYASVEKIPMADFAKAHKILKNIAGEK